MVQLASHAVRERARELVKESQVLRGEMHRLLEENRRILASWPAPLGF